MEQENKILDRLYDLFPMTKVFENEGEYYIYDSKSNLLTSISLADVVINK